MAGDIRPYVPGDEDAVVGVWHRSGLAAYPYLPTFQALTLDLAHHVFRETILPQNELWAGAVDDRIVAYLAMQGSLIDRLYVDPPEQGNRWGSRFIAHAKRLSPAGLELYTHQQNHRARIFYERHGFVAVKFGVSPPPESAPDVEYHWRPGGTGSGAVASG